MVISYLCKNDNKNILTDEWMPCNTDVICAVSSLPRDGSGTMRKSRMHSGLTLSINVLSLQM